MVIGRRSLVQVWHGSRTCTEGSVLFDFKLIEFNESPNVDTERCRLRGSVTEIRTVFYMHTFLYVLPNSLISSATTLVHREGAVYSKLLYILYCGVYPTKVVATL